MGLVSIKGLAAITSKTGTRSRLGAERVEKKGMAQKEWAKKSRPKLYENTKKTRTKNPGGLKKEKKGMSGRKKRPDCFKKTPQKSRARVS